MPILTRNDGVWALPDGDAYYDFQVRRHTTTDLTAERIHQLGLSEVARIEAEMDQLLQAEGYVEGSSAQRLTNLCQEPRFQYPDTARGRGRIVTDFQQIIDQISTGLDSYFDLQTLLGVEVNRYLRSSKTPVQAPIIKHQPWMAAGQGCFSSI